jgi:hypothetical protein
MWARAVAALHGLAGRLLDAHAESTAESDGAILLAE